MQVRTTPTWFTFTIPVSKIPSSTKTWSTSKKSECSMLIFFGAWAVFEACAEMYCMLNKSRQDIKKSNFFKWLNFCQIYEKGYNLILLLALIYKCLFLGSEVQRSKGSKFIFET